MSSPNYLFAEFDPIARQSKPSTPSNPPRLLPTYASHHVNTDPSYFAPIIHSPTAEYTHQSHLPPSFQSAFDDIRKEMHALSNRLDHVTSSHARPVQSVPNYIDSRPSSTHSIHFEQSPDKLSEEFLRTEAKYLRLKSELALRSQTNNNNCPVTTSMYSPLPLSEAPCQSIPTSLPFYSTTTNPVSTSSKYPSSSAFEPINKTSSLNSPTTTPPVIVQPLVSCHSMSTPNITMTINNNLPTFKGLAHERPIQFINDFEIRASALVGNNDSSLLQIIQQSLSDGALIWFGQLQKSSDRITTWSDFKTRFYERYHTPAKIQNLRTELRLLFQDDTEGTLDYFDRLKGLMMEIDPDCNDNWLKHKFIQKLRSDIRTRLDIDVHLPVRDIVRKAQLIESNIEQQKVDEKLKLAINQETQNLSNLIINNLTMSHNHHQQSPIMSNTRSFTNNNTYNNYNSSAYYRRNFANKLHYNISSNDNHFTNRTNQQPIHHNSNNNNYNDKNNYHFRNNNHHQKNHNNKRSTLHSINLPASYIPPYESASSSLPFYCNNLSRHASPSRLHHSNSLFEPAVEPISSISTTTTPHVTVESNAIPPLVNTNNPPTSSSTFSSMLHVHATSSITTSSHVIINLNDPTSTSVQPFIPLAPVTSSKLLPTPTCTVTLNNNLPIFKSLAHEKLIPSIQDSEFRASTIVRNNDLSHLQIIQQKLFNDALISFEQLQKSSNLNNSVSNFKVQFYQRYYTTTKIQNLYSELHLLLFQRRDEHMLDYFNYLKKLTIEIDLNYSAKWRKHKFKQKFFLFFFLLTSLF